MKERSFLKGFVKYFDLDFSTKVIQSRIDLRDKYLLLILKLQGDLEERDSSVSTPFGIHTSISRGKSSFLSFERSFDIEVYTLSKQCDFSIRLYRNLDKRRGQIDGTD